MTDTIFALSSGALPAAIAVMRVSGPKALECLSYLTARDIPPRRASLAELRSNGDLLDRAIVLRFDGPDTVTGEDLVELHLHGSRAVVAAVSAALSRIEGVRAAEAGEFTRRAFANGRVDLTEAEGLADLLAAETDSQRRAALHLAGGVLSRRVEAWIGRVLALAAAVEAQLDFSDEGDVDAGLPPSWNGERAAIVGEMQALLAQPPAERLKDGVRIVIAGPPNSGKSTLLNALAGREAAITSDIAGTTRDLIEVPVALGGVPILLIDSAGLRSSNNRIEGIGIDRARAAIDTADLVLWLGPPAQVPARENVLIVHSKSDIQQDDGGADITVSPITGAGMANLSATLTAKARMLLPREGEVSLSARHRESVHAAAQHLDAAGQQSDLLIAAEELRLVRGALDRLTGRSGTADMLDALFGRFCIGK